MAKDLVQIRNTGAAADRRALTPTQYDGLADVRDLFGYLSDEGLLRPQTKGT